MENFLCVKEDTPHTLMPHENKYFASIWDFLNHMLEESHRTFGNNYIPNLGTIYKIRYWETCHPVYKGTAKRRGQDLQKRQRWAEIQGNVLFSAFIGNTLKVGHPPVQQAC